MTTESYQCKEGPFDGETITIPSPAPARIIIAENGAILDVSSESRYPCYVRYVLEHDGKEIRRYEYEGEPPARA